MEVSMVITLLLTTFVVAFAVATLVVWIFNKPIESILRQVLPADLSAAWAKYLRFALYVVGIGGGVRVWDLEKYMTAQEPYKVIVELTQERLFLELYQTIIGTLQSTTILLLVFFVFALIAVVLVRLFEKRTAKPEATP
jgi:flagellar basal body-associated protein FliL